MTLRGYVVAIDQGTSSTKAVALDSCGAVVARSSVSIAQTHPQAGWVEQDPAEIAESMFTCLRDLRAQLEGPVLAVGISTQRESALIWDRSSGEPLGPVLGWQDRRTAERGRQLVAAGHDASVRSTTGLPIDPMFSAMKFEWLLNQADPDRSRSADGQIAVGTVDSWLLFRLTGEHRIEVGNASRTALLDLSTGEWSPAMLNLFRIPQRALPAVRASTNPSRPIVGVDGYEGVSVTAVLGDSHASLFAHAAAADAVKVTYGTGSSILGLLDSGTVPSGLVTTVAWGDPNSRRAFEGNILSTGATIAWLAALLGTSPDDLSGRAQHAPATSGVTLVPAFAGLGAPWWDENAQALICGLTLGTASDDLAYAAFESIVMQIEDVLSLVDDGREERIGTILADGGPSSNDWLMQLQADLSQRVVLRPSVATLSAVGVARMAAAQAGIDLPTALQYSTFRPVMDAAEAAIHRRRWSDAVHRSRSPELG